MPCPSYINQPVASSGATSLCTTRRSRQGHLKQIRIVRGFNSATVDDSESLSSVTEAGWVPRAEQNTHTLSSFDTFHLIFSIPLASRASPANKTCQFCECLSQDFSDIHPQFPTRAPFFRRQAIRRATDCQSLWAGNDPFSHPGLRVPSIAFRPVFTKHCCVPAPDAVSYPSSCY